ncbi:putative orfan [Tupanvirus soda lake]|uniref:Orfan n=2 Tax=Tupanvirus TaxID=2094720 RepID=A0AC62ACI9_9VIRU|nr:putative orfan [Tupanvirus soda lake]QKU35474.1 putative orfan [Tupanvirus soda lake]
MHIFIHLIILFIFVFALLMLNIPQIERNNYIMMKLYIFVGIFIFEFIVTIILMLFRKCVIDVGKIAKSSLESALVAVVAYSIYNDLVWNSNPLVEGHDTETIQNLAITVIITAFIAFGYFLEVIFTDKVPGMNDCLNTIYPPKSN